MNHIASVWFIPNHSLSFQTPLFVIPTPDLIRGGIQNRKVKEFFWIPGHGPE